MTVYSSDELKKLRLEEHALRYKHALRYFAEAMASRVSPAQEIPVTEEMVAAADNAWSGGAFRDAAAEIYRAMAAVAPNPRNVPYSEYDRVFEEGRQAKLRIAALEAQNTALSEAVEHHRDECKRLADGPPTQHPPEYVAKVLMDREGRSDRFEHARLTEVIRCARLDGRKQARDDLLAENTALKAQLAAFTTPPALEPKSFPAAALKPSKSDLRRVGG